jgi:hypothetical protein
MIFMYSELERAAEEVLITFLMVGLLNCHSFGCTKENHETPSQDNRRP